MSVINLEYKGIKFQITPELLEDAFSVHNVDVIAEAKRAIDLELQRIEITPTVDVENRQAKLKITRKL